MDYPEAIGYYYHRLNKKAGVSRIGWIFKFPNGRTYQLFIAVLSACAMLNLIFGLYAGIVFYLLGIGVSLEYYFKFKLREDIIDRCMVDEAYMDYCAVEKGEDPIDDEDRDGIFGYNYAMSNLRLTLMQNIKYYYKIVLFIVLIHATAFCLINYKNTWL
jgi:hypothetical protein